jgi:5-formyltetrahydrofolate cyclo-ligase
LYSNQTKKEWRTIARSLISEHASDISLRHVQKVIDSEEYKAAKIVALYFSVSTEPSTKEIISNAFAEHKIPLSKQILKEFQIKKDLLNLC